MNQLSKQYPIDYITYYTDFNNKQIPKEVPLSLKQTRKNGFYVLPLKPDNYDVPNEMPAFHAGFKHMRDITIPRMRKLFNKDKNLKGFFIAEGDLCLDVDYTFEKFLKENHKKPVWLGYKKKLSDYIVGNFLLYFPRSSFNRLEKYFQKQERLLFSDRFFTKLTYDEGFIKLPQVSVASEIEHESKVMKGIRKAKCHIKLK